MALFFEEHFGYALSRAEGPCSPHEPAGELLSYLQSWTTQLRKLPFLALSLVNKRTTIFHPPPPPSPTQYCFLSHEQFPSEISTSQINNAWGRGGGGGGEREVTGI